MAAASRGASGSRPVGGAPLVSRFNWPAFGSVMVLLAVSCSDASSDGPMTMMTNTAGNTGVAPAGGAGAGGTAVGMSGAVSVGGGAGGASNPVTAGAGASAAGAGGALGGAGAGSAAGAAGSEAGSGGTAGAPGAAGERPSGPSLGCGVVPDLPLDEPTQQMISVEGVEAMYQNREFFVRLPATYDVNHRYSLILLGHGCGGNGEGVVPIYQEAGEDAIVVGLSAVEACFATSGGMASPEIPFFDAVLADLESKYCIDTGKVFVAGFSSGAWLSNLLGCARGDMIRGIGTMAGGLSDAIQGQCVGHIAAMMMADTGDDANPIVNVDEMSGIDEGSGAARSLTAAANGCNMASAPWDAEFPDCVADTGCDPAHPVVWCETTGKGHSDHIPTSTVGLWRFWSSLP